jgi:hypothetical protein
MVLAPKRALARVMVVSVAGAVVALALAGGVRSTRGGLAARIGPGEASLAAATPAAASVRLYYTPPVLVRAGEPVLVPIDTACTTDDGQDCSTEVEVGTQVGNESWHAARRSAVGPEVFDLTAPSSRATGGGEVRFFVRATADSGAEASLGASRSTAALRFYVTERMPTVALPDIPFGEARKGEEVLALPWGTGPMRAGLEPGDESDSLGPTSFDVGLGGRIELLDALQQRLATFQDGRLVDDTGLPDTLFDVAVAEDGSALVLSRAEGSLVVRRVDPSGGVGAPAALGQGIPGQVRVSGGQDLASVFPLDGWVDVPAPGAALGDHPAVHAGRPVGAGAELLRVVRPQSVRLGMVVGGRVVDAAELVSPYQVGECALAESDGHGGYWVVLHVWRETPVAMDQYQAAHVRDDILLDSFAVPNQRFASMPIFNRFRMADGSLYQMTSSPEGMQIVRYRLGEES